jgi:hypothetical protein
MLRITINHSGQGAEKYFDVALKTGDYYTKGIGTWGGRGAERPASAGWGVGRLSHRWEGSAKRHTTLWNPGRSAPIKDSQTIKGVHSRIA